MPVSPGQTVALPHHEPGPPAPEPGGTHRHAGRRPLAAGGADWPGGARGRSSDPRAGIHMEKLPDLHSGGALLTSASHVGGRRAEAELQSTPRTRAPWVADRRRDLRFAPPPVPSWWWPPSRALRGPFSQGGTITARARIRTRPAGVSVLCGHSGSPHMGLDTLISESDQTNKKDIFVTLHFF